MAVFGVDLDALARHIVYIVVAWAMLNERDAIAFRVIFELPHLGCRELEPAVNPRCPCHVAGHVRGAG